MSTLIDGSSLLAERPTGVSYAVRELLSHNLLPIDGEPVIGTIRKRSIDHPMPNTRYRHLHRAIPTKLAHAYCLAGGSFAKLFPGSWNRLLLPNINIVGKPTIPYDLLVHDLSFLVHPRWFSQKMRLWHRCARPIDLIRGADRLFAVSPQTKRALIDLLHIPDERITIVPLRAREISLAGPLPRPIAEPYFFLLAADDPRKNSPCVEQAFLAFVKHHPEWKLVLAGTNKPRLHANIVCLPYLDDPARHQWMSHAAALLYPSWYEGYGLPPQEARSLGVPIITSSALTVAETAPLEAFFVPPFSPTLWTAAFEQSAKMFSKH